MRNMTSNNMLVPTHKRLRHLFAAQRGRWGFMTCVLTLEDGRSLHRSNLGYSVMLELIAREVSDVHRKFGAWLADMANRPAPYGEFDLRGLVEEHRSEFWAAAERALKSVAERHGPDEASWPKNAYGAESLAHLLRMHRSIASGEPPAALNDFNEVLEFDGQLEDIDFLWGDA